MALFLPAGPELTDWGQTFLDVPLERTQELEGASRGGPQRVPLVWKLSEVGKKRKKK